MITDRTMEAFGLSEQELNALATYNAEKARGIVHTDQWKIRMKTLQKAFDEHALCGAVMLVGGGELR